MRRLTGETIDVIVDEEREPPPEACRLPRRERVAAAGRDAVANWRACADAGQREGARLPWTPPLPATDASPRGGRKR